MRTSILFFSLLTLLTYCAPKPYSFEEAITFYSAFEGDGKAVIAKGDPAIYTTPNRREPDSTIVGMSANPNVELVAEGGLSGGALRFVKRGRPSIFYKCKENMVYTPQDWSGAVSFWLKVDPAKDLAPGFTDPIQITDANYNDASIWVDFTKENPRSFRLGVIGDLAYWDPDTIGPNNNPEYEKRLVTVNEWPFTSTSWTHVFINYQNLGTPNGKGELFLNGVSQGAIDGLPDPFTWDLANANLYLGLSFIGYMDDLAVFNRPLTSTEITDLYGLAGGLKEQVKKY